MSNCLGEWSYHEMAVKGEAHFWSLRRIDSLPKGTPLVSIQVCEQEIREYQAPDNTCPADEYIDIIRLWAKDQRVAIYDYEEED